MRLHQSRLSTHCTSPSLAILGKRSRRCADVPKPAPAKALGANRILHGKDNYPFMGSRYSVRRESWRPGHHGVESRIPVRRRGPRGVQLEEVVEAADALLGRGLKPTIDRPRAPAPGRRLAQHHQPLAGRPVRADRRSDAKRAARFPYPAKPEVRHRLSGFLRQGSAASNARRRRAATRVTAAQHTKLSIAISVKNRSPATKAP